MPIDPRIDPEIIEYLGAEAEWPSFPSLAAERDYWTQYCVDRSEPRPEDMAVTDRFLAGEGGDIPIRVYRPAEVTKANAPCILFSHGGGFVTGNLETNDTMCWRFAERCGAVLISVNYRHAPEYQYPSALEDVYSALCHVAGNPDQYDIDPDNIVVCGDSAGGNLSAGVCLLSRDRGGPMPAGQVLLYPGLGGRMDAPSYLENTGDPFVTLSAMKIYKQAYLGPSMKPSSVYGEPLQADDHTGLPPCYAIGSEFDPLRDDAKYYVEKLRAAGVPATFHLARGMPHTFLRLRQFSAAAAREFDAAADFIAQALGVD